MMVSKKVYGIEFNVTAVKAMTKTEFVKAYKGKFGDNSEDVYYQITGKAKPKPKKKD